MAETIKEKPLCEYLIDNRSCGNINIHKAYYKHRIIPHCKTCKYNTANNKSTK